jgi:hypothetical protein
LVRQCRRKFFGRLPSIGRTGSHGAMDAGVAPPDCSGSFVTCRRPSGSWQRLNAMARRALLSYRAINGVCPCSVQPVQMGQQYDTLLPIWIGAYDQGHGRFGLAGILKRRCQTVDCAVNMRM